MASTSRSTSEESFPRYKPPSTRLPFQSNKRYHVFLSFRGPDVRKTLVDHLFEALSVAGLIVYKDDENLEKGEEIWPSLKEAINGSAIFIPIFSKGYAESTWCLREAAEMVRTNGLIIPLFYYVDPTHVRYPEKENSPYCQSFQKHRGHSDRYGKEEIERWKNALLQICKRSGWSMDLTEGFEARLIKRVVNDLIKTLDRVPLQVAKHPVGLENVKNVLIQKLNPYSVDGVVKVGIWGIGGIGKTTVAKAVYNEVYLEFEAATFVNNVRATAAEPAGLTNLQKKILKDLAQHDREVGSVDEGIPLLRERLGGKRVLLILDDMGADNQVDTLQQLKALVGDWFASGSRVVITSRDKNILELAGVSNECIYEMTGLEIEESLQLFSWLAFLKKSPSLGYEDLSRKIVDACKGHPLSLEVIGSSLYGKQGNMGCWNEALHIITHNSDIYNRLYISYSSLSDEEKEIFVDIACYFIGEDKTLPIIFWESLYKKVHTAISNLSMKLLIKTGDEGLFEMHDHLRDMGRTIADKEKKGTRKWEPANLNIVSNNLSHLRLIGGGPQSLEMLCREGLRYLHLQNLSIQCMSIEDTLSLLPRSLIWLRLENCSFEVGTNRAVKKPRKARHLRIVDNIWQCKIMQINGCSGLELISVPNLPRSIINLSQLYHLDLTRCESLTSLPHCIGNLLQLQHLCLNMCEHLQSLPQSIGNLSLLQDLDLAYCDNLRSLPDSIGNLSQLQTLDLEGCESLSSLPDRIGNLSQLQTLDLGGCESLSSLPDSIDNLSQLQTLDLERCKSLSSLPDSIDNLSQLQTLDLEWCKSLSSLPDRIGNLSQLQTLDLGECQSLSSLPDSIGNLSQLQTLDLRGCESLSSLPDSIGNLSQLQKLDLTFDLTLHWAGCENLISLPDSIGNLSQLQQLSSLPDSIGNLSQLQQLHLAGCESLSSLPDSIGNLSQLQQLDLIGCESLSSLPDSIGNLSQLQTLDLRGCESLSSLPYSIGNLSQLQTLDLGGCKSLSSLPDSIGNLSQLQTLGLKYCESLLSSLPDSIGNLSQLRITRAVFDLDNLRDSETIYLSHLQQLH